MRAFRRKGVIQLDVPQRYHIECIPERIRVVQHPDEYRHALAKFLNEQAARGWMFCGSFDGPEGQLIVFEDITTDN